MKQNPKWRVLFGIKSKSNMKGLQFLGNRVEDAANAFIDVLKYSDQSVEYPDFKDIEPWPDEIINLFYVIWKNATFSELSAIIMYTQQSSQFDEISELMLGIGLVEMRHLDKISDFLQKADPYEDYSTMSINPNIGIGSTWEEAMKIALSSEMETIAHYRKIQKAIQQYEDRKDYDDVNYFLEKLIADEEHHVKLLKEVSGKEKSKGVTVIIK